MTRIVKLFAAGAVALILAACGKGDVQATASAPKPVAEDPFNAGMMEALKPALVVSLRVTDQSIELSRAGMMLAPSPTNYAGEQDRLTIIARGPSGQVSQIVAGDAAEIMHEGEGPVRLAERTVSVAVPAPRLIEKLEVTNSAGVSATFDVAPIMARYCARAARTDPACAPAERPAPG